MVTGPSYWVRMSAYAGPTTWWSTARCHITDIRAPARAKTLPAAVGLVCAPLTTCSANASGTPAFWAKTLAAGKVSWISRSAPSQAWTRVWLGRVSPGDEVALVGSHDGGALLRVVAGDLAGHRGPGSTHSPIIFVHATLAPGARVQLPWPKDHNALVYVLSGDGSVGAEDATLRAGQLAVLDRFLQAFHAGAERACSLEGR